MYITRLKMSSRSTQNKISSIGIIVRLSHINGYRKQTTRDKLDTYYRMWRASLPHRHHPWECSVNFFQVAARNHVHGNDKDKSNNRKHPRRTPSKDHVVGWSGNE
jgi:hypothetical protein